MWPSRASLSTLLCYADLAHEMHRTLIDSTPGVLKAWETFSADYSLGDSAAIAHATHGRRLYDTLKEYCHIEDEAKLQVCVPSLFHSVRHTLTSDLWGIIPK
jgi:beta-phosphoglucomutase-like phosphatase (HAD superfamily)